MKVAVSSSGPGMESYLDIRFGRCPYFVVVDTETGEHEDIPNTAAEAGSGAGIGAASAIAKAGAEAVLTGNVGPNAVRALQQLGVKVYQASGGTVKDALNQFLGGTCPELTGATAPARAGMGRGQGGGGMGAGGGRGRGGRGQGRGGRKG